MQKNKLLKAGLVGSIVTAICCFTPFLVVIFGLAGLSPLVIYLDVVLLPLLVVFVGITAYALWKKSKT
jgi:mercuric ion transport protein|tara:strand:- start:141 stop:344 length:204 start_codon:yes stop_codon:yes gene_type:complete